MYSWPIDYGLILHVELTWWTQMMMVTMFHNLAINLMTLISMKNWWMKNQFRKMNFQPFYLLIMIPSYIV